MKNSRYTYIFVHGFYDRSCLMDLVYRLPASDSLLLLLVIYCVILGTHIYGIHTIL